jgi:signal transduction histidine kinase/ligand-binding sensor domain-containing protein/DNA-binding response OmpR family regulator
LLCCLDAFPLYFKHLGTADGLPQISVMSIYQDELGRMWFGTMEGISIYDGEKIRNLESFEAKGGEPAVGNENHSITGDYNGNIYFISDHALMRFNCRSQKFDKIREPVSALAFLNNEIWTANEDSVCIWDEKTGKFRFRACLNNKNLSITQIFMDSQNRLWLGTNRGLYVEENGAFKVYIPDEDIYNIFEDSRLNMWISTRYRNFYRKRAGGSETPCQMVQTQIEGFNNQHIRCFVEDDYGTIWLGSFSGLLKYDYSTGRFAIYRKDDLPGSLWHSSVFSLCRDRQGSIWVGTYYGGVHHFNPKDDIFRLYPEDAQRNDCVSFSFVGRMTEDSEGKIWICTEGGGLNCLDRETGKIEHFKADGKPNSIAHNNLKSICYSEKLHRLFIGTHTGGLSVFDLHKRQFRNFRIKSGTSDEEVMGNVVNQVELYGDKYLVMLTQKGFYRFDPLTEQISPLFDWPLDFTAATNNFAIDRDGFLWAASGNRIVKINLENQTEQEEFIYGRNTSGTAEITRIFIDRKGRIFVGTKGSGLFLFDRKKKTFDAVEGDRGQLKNIRCYDIAESTNGYIIILNHNGIAFLHPNLNQVVSLDLQTALPISGVNLGCGLLACRNGEIFAGGIDGMTSFFEQELFSFSPADYNLYFSELFVNNDITNPFDNSGILKTALPYASEIRLKHNQNNLAFTFTSNNYTTTLDNPACEYMLEGFDRRWITGDNRHISYTNLNPGHYTLLVREQQTDPAVEPRTIKMNVVINKPFYATPLFYAIYILLAVGLAYWYYRFKRSQLLLRASLEFERKEKEQNEQLNNAKLQFFMNISHEFRTPLTLITSQIEALLQSNSLTPYVYNKLLKIFRNTHHFRGLITELLDFRKLELGHVRLKVSEQDLIPFAKEIYLLFSEYAENNGIAFRFSAPNESLVCTFDPQQLQKVFYNLLSNAFKYSQAGGTVEMSVADEGQFAEFKIIDSGIGIDRNEISQIFDRFYQGSNNAAGSVKTSGSGIGLSLTKGIVELHHGTIKVDSAPGYGTIFTVRLPKGKEHFAPEDFAAPKNEIFEMKNEFFTGETAETPYPINAQDIDNDNIINAKRNEKVLLVEDNPEMLELLTNLFSESWQVAATRNGREGLEKARSEQPDVIVSDIMMPEMTGIEMCRKIKSDFETCHIPVVLLTALSSEEQRLAGFQRGADDFISKPFNPKLLIARCNNLIRNRNLLQKKFSEQKDIEVHFPTESPLDRKFMDAVIQAVESNIGNSGFDIVELARELAISRSSLYAKFKALTGQTPNEFLLDFRLKRAAALLKDAPELNITDIADRLGFNSARYFSRCFKSAFGKTPAEYRKW